MVKILVITKTDELVMSLTASLEDSRVSVTGINEFNILKNNSKGSIIRLKVIFKVQEATLTGIIDAVIAYSMD